MAGSADSIVPVAQSQRLYEAASHPKEFVMIEGADHNELTGGNQLVAEVAAFLDNVILADSS